VLATGVKHVYNALRAAREALMITLIQPSMALNAQDVPGPDYVMWNTWKVPQATPAVDVLGWTANVARGAPGGRLNAILLNGHGSPAHVSIGTGIGWPEVPLFASLIGLVNEVYITACEVVSFTGPGDENLFCGSIAKAAGGTGPRGIR
jgi:hypothetical protein